MPSIILLVLSIFISFNLFNTVLGLFIGASMIWVNLILFLSRNQKLKNPKFSIFSFFVIWVAYALLQLIFVEHDPKTFHQLQTLINGVILIWAMSKLINSQERIKTLYKSWGFAVLCTNIIGWWEVLTDRHLPLSGADFYSYHNVATVNFFNPNDYAFYLVISLPVVFYWLGQRGIFRFLGLFMLISSFYFMYTNEARFILVIFFLVTFAYFIKLGREKKVKHLLSFIAIIMVVVFYFKDTVKEAIDSLYTLNGEDESVGVRGYLTDAAMKIFQENPLGVGPGNLELHMPRVGFGSSVHNFWLEILVNYGILIFLGFVSFYFVCLYRLTRSRTKELKNTITPIFWAVIIFIPACVQSSSIFSFNITWFLFGVMVSAVNVLARKNKKIGADTNIKDIKAA